MTKPALFTRALPTLLALALAACATGPSFTATAPASTLPATAAASATPFPVLIAPATAAATAPGAPTAAGRPVVQDAAAQEDWRADLATLAKQIRSQHPNPFFRTTEADFQAQVDALNQDIPYLTRDQIILGLIRISALIDGHTHIQITQPALGYHIYPLHLYEFSDGLYVVDALPPYRAAIGARVVRLGRLEAADLLAALTPLTNHDNDQTIRSVRPLFAVVPEVLLAAGIITATDQPALVLQKPGGAPMTLNPAPVSFDTYRAAWPSPSLLGLPQQPAPLYLSRRAENFWYTFLANTQTLYIQYNQVQYSTAAGPSISAFCQQLADFAAHQPIARVVLDLRNNFGGETFAFAPMLALLSQNPAFNRPGRLYTLIGRQTFSAADLLAAGLQLSTTTVFVGEPTGGSPNLYGNTRPARLPHSGISVDISTGYFQGSTAGDHRDTLAPQIAVPLSSSDYFAQRDPALAAILATAATTPTVTATPEPSLAPQQVVSFTTADGVVLRGTQYGRGAQAVIFSNVGSGRQAEWGALPQQAAHGGRLALTYDWRGVGASGGAADYTRADRDLAAAIAFARAQGATQIVLVGGSLGGMASLMNAAAPEVAGLVVLSSPQTAPDFEITGAQLAAARAPKLFVANRQDTVVTYAATEALYTLAPQPKTLVSYAGAAHGSAILASADGADLAARILAFVAERLQWSSLAPNPAQVLT